MSEPARFAAMGCEVVVAGAAPDELEAVRETFAEHDARFSRFRSDSELSRVNATTAPIVEVSALFAEAMVTAIAAWHATDGLVDPTLLDALEHAGYDADFDTLPAWRDAPRQAPPARGRPDRIHVAGRLLIRPPGTRLDLAGVVKGLCVDTALGQLRNPGFVCAGGDLAATRPVTTALPAGGSVRLMRGALATSSPARRRWVVGDRERHHLIDPRTGEPSDSPWSAVTVCGTTCAGADVAAKAAYLRGRDAVAWLDAHGLPGRLVAHDGAVTVTRAWRAMTEVAAACI